MTTPTLLQAAQAVVDTCDPGRHGAIVLPTFVITDLRQAIEREKAMSPKPVSGTSSGRHCGSCKHDIHPMPARCYKCGVGDLSNWEPKP